MEQTIDFDDTAEYLCGICTNSFRGDTLIRHLTEHIGIPDKRHTHFLWCKLCSPLLRDSDAYGVSETGYSNEIDLYIPPEEQNNSLRTRYNHGLVKFHPDYSDNVDPYGMYQNYFYDGTNPGAVHPSQSYSVGACWEARVYGGTTFFYPRVSDEHVQSQKELTNTGNQHADVACVGPRLKSTCTENSYVKESTIVEMHQKATKTDTQQIDATYATPNVSDEHVPYVQSQEDVTNTGNQHADVACVGPRLKLECTENSCVEDSTIVEMHHKATKTDTQRTDATCNEPCLEATNAEIPCVDNIKTPPVATEAETVLEDDISEVSDALNESVSKSSNSKGRPYTSNSNRKRIRKNSNHAFSSNSSNLADGPNSSGHNSCEHADSKDWKSIGDYVDNDGSRDQNCCDKNSSGNANSRLSNGRYKSSNVSGNSNSHRIASSGIYFKNLNNRLDGPSSSDHDSHNSKNKLRYNQNGNNNILDNANSSSTLTNNDNSDAASSRAGGLNRNDLNGTRNAHCYNEPVRKSQGKGKFSGAFSEVSESHFSYSAAVKRSLNCKVV